MDLLTELTILVLAAFVGFEVISKVPNTLHTPLMSATNAIHGIVLLGGLYLIGPADGFLNELLLRDRHRVRDDQRGRRLPGDRPDARHVPATRLMYTASFLQDPDFIRSLYIVAFVLFILDLRLMNHPRTARQGNLIGAVGMGDRGDRDAPDRVGRRLRPDRARASRSAPPSGSRRRAR